MTKYLIYKNVNMFFNIILIIAWYVKQHIKTLPESTSGKTTFLGKI